MAWIADMYQAFRSDHIDALGSVTGKPVAEGGVLGRLEEPAVASSMRCVPHAATRQK